MGYDIQRWGLWKMTGIYTGQQGGAPKIEQCCFGSRIQTHLLLVSSHVMPWTTSGLCQQCGHHHMQCLFLFFFFFKLIQGYVAISNRRQTNISTNVKKLQYSWRGHFADLQRNFYTVQQNGSCRSFIKQFFLFLLHVSSVK